MLILSLCMKKRMNEQKQPYSQGGVILVQGLQALPRMMVKCEALQIRLMQLKANGSYSVSMPPLIPPPLKELAALETVEGLHLSK